MTPTITSVIEIKNLTRQYPVLLKREVVVALNDVSLTVRHGEVFGLVGTPGAGKTTVLKILLGLLPATQGTATVFGRPAGEIETLRRISYLPDTPGFYEHLTAVEMVTFYGQMFGMTHKAARKKADSLVDFVGLGAMRNQNKRLSEYSKGMRQRVGIAQALVNEPELLFLDEPSANLDTILRREMRDLIRALRQQGRTIFVASSQWDDIESVCDRLGILDRGKLQSID